MENQILLSAGIDVGTTTTHLIISRIGIAVEGGFGTVPHAVITNKEIIYESKIYFTPLDESGNINGAKVAEIIKKEYASAGFKKEDFDSGAVIITGESSKKENAKQVLADIAEYSGNFIAAQAGSQLESYLSGKGAGADKFSEQSGVVTANIDIGGGTTNISYFKDGDCVDDCCLNIGGRLVRFDKSGKATLTPEMERLCADNGITVKSISDFAETEKLCNIAADIIKNAVFSCGSVPGYCITDSLPCGKYVPEAVSFSGGVAECFADCGGCRADFGDIGYQLAAAIRKSSLSYPAKIINSASSPIRATVIGAGNFSMDISGSTIEYSNVELPIKNLECVSDFSRIGSEMCAVSLPGDDVPGFGDLVCIAKDIAKSCSRLIEKGLPVVVVAKADFSKALGICLRRVLPPGYPFICFDGVDCRRGNYIDIGAPVAGGKAVPVVVKTLVFGGKDNYENE